MRRLAAIVVQAEQLEARMVNGEQSISVSSAPSRHIAG